MTENASAPVGPSAPLAVRAQPITPAERSLVAGVALVGAGDQLAELAADLDDDPDLQLPAELVLSGIGPLQLFGVSRWLRARAGLYGVEA